MASVFNVLRTCGLIVYLIFYVHATQNNLADPWIVSFKVQSKTCLENCKYLLNVKGGEFLGHNSWRLTFEEASRGGKCDVISSNYEIREIETKQWLTKIELVVPIVEGKLYFCLRHDVQNNAPFGGRWVHQGQELYLDPENDFASEEREANKRSANQVTEDNKANLEETTTAWADLSHDVDVNNLSHNRLTREEKKDIEVFLKDRYVPLDEVERLVKDRVEEKKDSERDMSQDELFLQKDDRSKKIVNKFTVVHNLNGVDFKYDLGNERDVNRNILRKKRDLHLKDRIIKDRSKEDLVVNDNFYEAQRPVDYLVLKDDLNRKDTEERRKKRESNITDDLISTQDILKAKMELENSIKRPIPEENHEDALIKSRRQRQVSSNSTEDSTEPVAVKIDGLRIEDSDKEPKIIDYSVPSVLADSKVSIRFFGDGLTSRTVIAFTYHAQEFGQPCKFLVKGEYLAKEESVTPRTALFEVIAPPPMLGSKLYICAKNLKPGNTDILTDDEKYIHQGTETYKIIATHNKLLPLWVSITLILTCLMFSALFSGLNLGLMSLDRTELKIISNTGTEQERKYARAIMPVRDHGNYLLCSILLGNVAVNSTFTILLDELTSGLFAVLFSTLSIVLLGEITPQAICSRHGLMVGAKSIMITKAVMALTAPLAFPVSKLLDYFLGEEIGSVYNRERLKELVKVTTDVNDLDKDEVNIISGALELRKKTVSHVMTKLEDVFMLPISSVLDFETMSEIIKSGYSRIPVFEGHRGNIVTVLFIKDLAFVDPDDNTPLRTLCQYYQNPCNFVFEDVTLDVMFKQFKEGHKGHMAFVHRINNEGEGDPFYETIGLVTLEDVIEEMIQAEIIDETDVFMDNRTKKRRNRPQYKHQDFTAFAERHEHQRTHISPQLTLATFQFLSSSVDAFRPDTVSETVLRRLLKQDVIHHIKLKGKTKKDACTYVYQQAKPVDYFVLILEGRVEVTVGRENLVFEAGPFTYFGVQALTQNVGVAESPTPSAMGSLQNINMDAMLRHTFVPDYSVRAITELYYLTVKRSLYLAAKRATLMEKGALSKGATNEQFDTEVDKHLCNTTANIPISLISKKLLGKSNSTTSTKDGMISPGPTKVSFDLSSHTHIIELLQVPPQHSDSESSSLCGVHKTAASWPSTDISVHCAPNTTKFAGSWEADKCWNSLQEPTPFSPPTHDRSHNSAKSQSGECVSKTDEKQDIDANSCTFCVKNHFWLNRNVAGRTLEGNDVRGGRGGEEREGQPPPLCECEWRRERTQLLQSVDEDMSISGEHKTPSRQVSPNPLPVSASPHTRSSFVSRASPEPRNGDVYAARADEQEKLLKSP